MEYKVSVVSSIKPNSATDYLEKSVNEYIKDGFKPYGYIQATNNCGVYTLFQAMIKED